MGSYTLWLLSQKTLFGCRPSKWMRTPASCMKRVTNCTSSGLISLWNKRERSLLVYPPLLVSLPFLSSLLLPPRSFGSSSHFCKDTTRSTNLRITVPLNIVHLRAHQVHQSTLQVDVALGHKTGERFVVLFVLLTSH